ncbi:MAG: hypothetical protein Q8P59_03945 [Dehalococcoidia bacterium]|nr:hypothetical protein [Dehalococcoidia bacterium]
MAGETQRTQPALTLEVGAAASGVESYLLVEEGEAGPHPSMRRKGNLYLLAHGAQGAHLLRAARDQYSGDPFIGGPLEVSLGVLDSLEAAAALLAPREAGVSCLAAVTNSPNRLTLVGVGDCRAFLEERRKGSPQPLLAPRYPHKKLAMEAPGVIERMQRSLGPGDRVILCCGPLAQAWGVNELAYLLSSNTEASSQDLANELAAQAEAAGGGAAVVIACREGDHNLASEPAYFASKGYDPDPQAHALLTAAGRRKGPKLPLPWLLAVFAVVIVGSATMDTLGRYVTLPSISLPADLPGVPKGIDADLWNQVEALWSKGQKGDVEAWREAVSLLQKLQSAQPGDAGIIEKLRAAESNRQYAEAMGQVALLWGTGETSARRVESWAQTVQVLQDLQAKLGGTGFLKAVVDKLYAAQVNYGKALEAAGRATEARSVYEKARELDPARPEAVDALRKLR